MTSVSPASPFTVFLANLIGSMPPGQMEGEILVSPLENSLIVEIGPHTIAISPTPNGRWAAAATIVASGTTTEISTEGKDPYDLGAWIGTRLPETGGDSNAEAARDWLAALIAMLESDLILAGVEVGPAQDRSQWIVKVAESISGFGPAPKGSGRLWECDEALGDDPMELGAITAFAFNADYADYS